MWKVLLAIAVIGLAIILFWNRSTPSLPPATALAVSGAEFTLRSKGWSQAELDAILSDFAAMYQLSGDTFRSVEIETGTFEIDAVHPIGGAQLLYLVNYLHYPKNFDLTDRHFTVGAKFTLGDRFGAPNELAGRQAVVYVPSGDTEHDEVFARVDPESHFRISFTNLQWTAVSEGREPKAIARLMQ